MKKIFTTMLLALVCGMALQAQDADYQPLVREGVRWINRSFIYFEGAIFDPHYYGIEFSGDTIINVNGTQVVFKKCYSFVINKDYYSSAINFSKLTPAAYMMEEDKKVYCLNFWAMITHRPPTILYDFSHSEQAILGDTSGEGLTESFTFVGTETICGHECRVFSNGADFGKLVESIGLVSRNWGDLIDAAWEPLAVSAESYYGLSFVIDTNGNIIYRGPNYRFFASDINGDNKVDISDVNEVINVMLGKSVAAADVNGDGVVDISDVNMVINAMLGK